MEKITFHNEDEKEQFIKKTQEEKPELFSYKLNNSTDEEIEKEANSAEKMMKRV